MQRTWLYTKRNGPSKVMGVSNNSSRRRPELWMAITTLIYVAYGKKNKVSWSTPRIDYNNRLALANASLMLKS